MLDAYGEIKHFSRDSIFNFTRCMLDSIALEGGQTKAGTSRIRVYSKAAKLPV